ncbi:MAG: SCP2 sterol-binding domain-containing protein [Candidatus Helarchaeota archaeon]|nr:SCP2 sterol-binding domain-containing protein [Candidatus Helarchaeota archaeon]
MKYYDLIASRMLMCVILYSISELSKYNNEVKNRIKDHQLNIQFSVEDGPIEYLEIKNDKILFERRKKLTSFDARIHFKDEKAFLKILKKEQINFKQLLSEGKIEINEDPKYENICVDLLNLALPYANYTKGENLSAEDELVVVKILMYAMLSGFQEISEVDENVQTEMKGTSVIVQFNITNGPQCYYYFNDGTFTGFMDVQHPNPTVNIVMSDLKSALALLTGQGNATRMLIKGTIQIEGDTAHAAKLMSLQELISDYQDYIKAKRRK